MRSLAEIKQVFLDMDGTIYEGTRLYPATLPFLDFLKKQGIRYTFMSNNSSYSRKGYVEKLHAMGCSAKESDFYSSVEYTIDYLRQNHPDLKKFFLLGMSELIPEFQEAGFEFSPEAPQCVIVAFDRSLTFEKLCKAAYWLQKGVPGFATHPDASCPTDQEPLLVDCGSITKALEYSAHAKLKVLGKPDPGMLCSAAAHNGFRPEECLMIGDRMETDIAVGANAGALTCLITSSAAAHASGTIVPDYEFRDLGELQTEWENQLKHTQQKRS